VTPLSPERYQIRFTASAEMREKLRRAQEQLRHAIPTGDPAEVFDRALTALLEHLARTRVAAMRSPAAERKQRVLTAGSRHIPARVKRAVWLRDGGQCAFVAATGQRCRERGFLEFHHRRPYAVGGEPTVGNIELRCRAHNLYEADVFYGPMRVQEPRAFSGALRSSRASPA
jgi:5-methylcytosine-specific restriction endonuclease McrA